LAEYWKASRREFRLQGQSHQLVVLSDLTRALRSEERQAWKRLVQVLRHEINNSLAPIHSLADSLRNLLSRDPRPDDWEDDVAQGLNVITGRSEGLNRFMASYAQLTKLPKPDLQPINVAEWIQSIVNLEPNPRVSLITGSSITIKADSAQLDQVLINLIKNAIEAVQETGGDVRVGWLTQTKKNRCLIIFVEDQGIGISNPDNLFVPFFTTKPQGSGLGLMISRQIAEAHGGTLILENRIDGPGCIAKLSLPI
jgi:nitrogen fixation/metabolism regulation signal transduction histidine kinase